MPSEASTTGGSQELVSSVERLRRELFEAHRRESATAEILRVISSSSGDVQPVFEAIVQSAAKLCDGLFSALFTYDGDLIHQVAQHNYNPEALEQVRRAYPMRPTRARGSGRCILERAVVHMPDFALDAEYDRSGLARNIGYRSGLFVPMLRKGAALGVISVARTERGPFSEHEIDLLKTFADQAVIAIENARLFEEVRASKRELQESLEYQTAISDVLSVISKSPHALQPVLDAIMTTASRHVPLHVPDLMADPLISGFQRSISDRVRTALTVPLKRNGIVVGLISLWHDHVQPFTQRQIDLVATFADQAVIAINNVGLFEEVQARNRDLTALGEVGRAVSSTLDLKVVLKTIVDRAVLLSGTDAGSIFYYRDESGTFELGETSGFDEQFAARIRRLDIAARNTGLGEALAKRRPVQFPDVAKAPNSALRDAMLGAGLRAALIVPLLGAEGPLGALVLRQRRSSEFPEGIVSLMQAFADQSAIALENARLFEEIAQKSRELEIASHHKSQFVANMSHELRTPLAAILGYAELMQEGFYEPLGQKSLDALSRIRSNGKHLLGLINTVLDIAKIESGQFSLNLGEYALENVIETVRAATEALAQNKKLALKTVVAKSLPVGLGDEQRLTQVLLNLVGNAIKFTDTGEVRVTAKAINGHFVISVADTGPGIPEQEQKRIFEQFHQIDSSLTKAKGGTGLGLAIAKQIVEMHGGRIWVESTPGKGAIFQMELPTRAELRKNAP